MVMFVPWPPCRQPFTRSLWADQEKEEKRCPFSIEEKDRAVKSSKFIAEKLADYDEIGFEILRTCSHSSRTPRNWCIYHQALERLAFIADSRKVPFLECEHAARCGGLPPYPNRLPNIVQTPMLADVDDATYGAVVRKLTRCTKLDSDLDLDEAVCVLIHATDYRLACYCRAALAAALVAHTVENGTDGTDEFTWTDVKGGVWGTGDIPTRQE